MTYFALVKKGYGTLEELKKLDTFELSEIIAYENMMGEIEALAYEEANDK